MGATEVLVQVKELDQILREIVAPNSRVEREDDIDSSEGWSREGPGVRRVTDLT